MNKHALEQPDRLQSGKHTWMVRGAIALFLLGALALVQNGAGAPVALAASQIPSSFGFSQWETKPSGNWINGNLGSSNSDYAEGEVIPQRIDVGTIANGDYFFSVCRDYLNSGKYGYLFLDAFNASRPASAGGTITSSLGAFDGVNVTIVSVMEVGAQGSCNGSAALETIVNITIAKPVGGTTAYVLWGGHLAAPGDTIPIGGGTVPLGSGAGSFPGSSLHMSTIPNKDNQINPSSILPAPLITIRKFQLVGSTLQPLNGWCFSITVPAAPYTCAGTNSNVLTFSNLALGSYTVSELLLGGWQFVGLDATTSINCPQSGSTGAVTLTATKPTARCDFVNRAIATSVTLNSFKAVARAKNVKLKWRTGSELNVVGFSVYRSTEKNGTYELLNESLLPAAHPGQPLTAKYKFLDSTAQAGVKYYYKLELVDPNLATLEFSEIVKVRTPPSP